MGERNLKGFVRTTALDAVKKIFQILKIQFIPTIKLKKFLKPKMVFMR